MGPSVSKNSKPTLTNDKPTCLLKDGQCMGAGCGSDQPCGVNYIAGKCDPCSKYGGTWAPEQTDPNSGGKYGNGYHCLLGLSKDVECPKGIKQEDCFGYEGKVYYLTGSETEDALNCWQNADCGENESCLPLKEGSHIGKTCEELLNEYGNQRPTCNSGYKLGIKGTGRILPGGDSKTAPGPCQFECKKNPPGPTPSPGPGPTPVSYTHLTLPTKRIV